MRATVLFMACLAVGCGSLAQVRFGGPPRPPEIDQEVVESLLCRGRADEAARYIELRGGSLADRIERIERAHRATRGEAGCCNEESCKESQS